MKILIIEDDERIANPVREELQYQKYVVDCSFDGAHGLEMALLGQYDIIILDLMLPKMSGFEICQRLREKGVSSSVLMLTARSEKQDKILGLDAGADDYLTKPFDLDELSARVRALSRRPAVLRKSVIDCGAIQIDTAECTVTCGDTQFDLTPTEYRLLVHFARYPGEIFKVEELLDKLWSQEETPGKEAIKTHVKTLRKKLAAGGVEALIETVYGFGYRLKQPC